MPRIQLKTAFVYSMAVMLSGVAFSAGSVAEQGGLDYSSWIGEDLYLQGQKVMSADLEGKGGDHLLLFKGRFLVSIGANRFSSDEAMVWLKENRTEFRGRTRTEYQATVYLQGSISVKRGKGAKISGLREKVDWSATSRTII